MLNLRGNQRTQGERSRREGGKIFGQGSRAPVAITILVRNPDPKHDGCHILYRDIGDYLKREEKLAILRETDSIAGIEDWQVITPDKHHDWIGLRSDAFQRLYPMGSKEAKAGKAVDTIFGLYSRGLATSRDVYIYNFSRDACAENARKMVDDYLGALRALEECQTAAPDVDDITRRHSANVRWDQSLKDNLSQKKRAQFDNSYIRNVTYRPFIATHCYADYTFSQRPAQMRVIFPDDTAENRAICVPGVGSTKPFSALVVDTMPDLELISKSQCFPRYRYRQPTELQGELLGIGLELERIDNIADTALRQIQAHYCDNSVTKDAIFDYVYGILHNPGYRERFANDLTKELPRIPFAPDFHAFAEAGARLTALHLGYETCEEYPLDVTFTRDGETQREHFRIGEQIKFADVEKTTLIINEHVSVRNIPASAHGYVVNGRTPLEWFIDRYQVTRDKENRIVNDPNGWFDDPRELIKAIRRIVHVSVATMRIIEALPESIETDPASKSGTD